MLKAYPDLKRLVDEFNSMDAQDVVLHDQIMFQTKEIIEEFKKDRWPTIQIINSDADLQKLMEQFFFKRCTRFR